MLRAAFFAADAVLPSTVRDKKMERGRERLRERERGKSENVALQYNSSAF